MQMELKLWREGKFVLISSDILGITTQGKTINEALLNFQDAFLMCIHDADWRRVHSISDTDYVEFIKSEQRTPTPQTTTIDLSEVVRRLIENVKKTSASVGVATS